MLNYYRLLEAGEIDGERAFITAGTERRHGDIGYRRQHHNRGRRREKDRYKQMPYSTTYKQLHHFSFSLATSSCYDYCSLYMLDSEFITSLSA